MKQTVFCCSTSASLYKAVILQVELQDVVFDSNKDKPNVLCVCGTGEVGVNNLPLIWIKI